MHFKYFCVQSRLILPPKKHRFGTVQITLDKQLPERNYRLAVFKKLICESIWTEAGADGFCIKSSPKETIDLEFSKN